MLRSSWGYSDHFTLKVSTVSFIVEYYVLMDRCKSIEDEGGLFHAVCASTCKFVALKDERTLFCDRSMRLIGKETILKSTGFPV